MKKQIYMCLILVLCCGCGKQIEETKETIVIESHMESMETVESQLTSMEETEDYLTLYQKQYEEDQGICVNLIYVDEDDIPEMLYVKGREYKLFTIQDDQLVELELEANTSGRMRETRVLYGFEYIPFRNTIRTQSTDTNRDTMAIHYYALKNGQLKEECTTSRTVENPWLVIVDGKESDQETFLNRYEERQYENLVVCDVMHENVSEAFLHLQGEEVTIGFDDFIAGNVDAYIGVDRDTDLPLKANYLKYYEYDDEETRDCYLDYDEDGIDELYITNMYGSVYLFEEYLHSVQRIYAATSTIDNVSFTKFKDGIYILSTDLMHGGREYWSGWRYDTNGVIIDYFTLTVDYEGSYYDESSEFYYCKKKISMQEYEEMAQLLLDGEVVGESR